MPEAVAVFIAPPSREALRARLVGRGTDAAGQIEQRLATAEHELEAQPEFAHVVVNDRLEEATDELERDRARGAGGRAATPAANLQSHRHEGLPP